MQKRELILVTIIMVKLMIATQMNAQDTEKVSDFNVSADLYSNYIWRGSKLGQGPSVQPAVKFVKRSLTLGVWGAFDASGYSEVDPYISYSLPVGLSFGLTDYYYPDLPVFETSDTTGSHVLEINAGFAKAGLNLSANYVVNQAGGAGSSGGDMYFQAGYSFAFFSLFAGAGDGWHTNDGKFAICNLGNWYFKDD
jgi:hypothetical protein